MAGPGTLLAADGKERGLAENNSVGEADFQTRFITHVEKSDLFH